jgi:hypothetical protein
VGDLPFVRFYDLVDGDDAAEQMELPGISKRVAEQLEEEIEARHDYDLGCILAHMQFTHLRAVALSRLLIESVRLELVVKIGF